MAVKTYASLNATMMALDVASEASARSSFVKTWQAGGRVFKWNMEFMSPDTELLDMGCIGQC